MRLFLLDDCLMELGLLIVLVRIICLLYLILLGKIKVRIPSKPIGVYTALHFMLLLSIYVLYCNVK